MLLSAIGLNHKGETERSFIRSFSFGRDALGQPSVEVEQPSSKQVAQEIVDSGLSERFRYETKGFHLFP